MPAAAPACWLSNHADRVLAATNAIVVCRRAEDRRHAIFERRFEPMTIKISVLKETKDGERRVAMVPAVAPRIVKLGATLSLQAGAGEAATFADSAYVKATIVADPGKLVADADIVLAVQAPSASVVRAMKPGAVLSFSSLPRVRPNWLQRSRSAR